MSEINSLPDLYIDELKDLWSANQQAIARHTVKHAPASAPVLGAAVNAEAATE